MLGGVAPEFPPFRSRPPWWGADLQTLRNFLTRVQASGDGLDAERLTLPLADGSGDALSGLLQRPVAGGAERPLAVLVHGLAGSEDSSYMGVSAAQLLARGHRVLRLNLRGAGRSRPLCRLQYHAGRSGDLRDALAALPASLTRGGLLLVGYSLGGNLLLKFLAEHAAALPVLGAVSVSAPIDLAAASRRFLHPRNAVYQWHLLRGMKRESLGPGARVTDAERAAIRGSRTVLEFDDRFVAPRNGYRGADEYYAENSAERFLARIRVPTLLIQARDDPWIPPDAYLRFPWSHHPQLTPLLPARGGHVGFHARGGDAPWHDRCIAAHAERLAGSAEAVESRSAAGR